MLFSCRLKQNLLIEKVNLLDFPRWYFTFDEDMTRGTQFQMTMQQSRTHFRTGQRFGWLLEGLKEILHSVSYFSPIISPLSSIFSLQLLKKRVFFVTAYFLLLEAQKPLMAELWSYPITRSGSERSSKPVHDHRKEEGTELGCILLPLKTPSCGTMGHVV